MKLLHTFMCRFLGKQVSVPLSKYLIAVSHCQIMFNSKKLPNYLGKWFSHYGFPPAIREFLLLCDLASIWQSHAWAIILVVIQWPLILTCSPTRICTERLLVHLLAKQSVYIFGENYVQIVGPFKKSSCLFSCCRVFKVFVYFGRKFVFKYVFDKYFPKSVTSVFFLLTICLEEQSL